MYIFNISFMIEPARYEELLGWIRLVAMPAVTGAEPGVTEFQLATLIEVPGDSDFDQQARSVALQLGFDTLEVVHRWQKDVFPGLMKQFTGVFGQQAVAFCTVLQKLPL